MRGRGDGRRGDRHPEAERLTGRDAGMQSSQSQAQTPAQTVSAPNPSIIYAGPAPVTGRSRAVAGTRRLYRAAAATRAT